MRLNDVTCPECGYTLRYGATYTNKQGQTIQEWYCGCGYSRDDIIKETKDNKNDHHRTS